MQEDEPSLLESIPDTDPDFGGRGFSYRGKTLLSGVDPSGRADCVADAVEITDRTLYLCPSPLYGYGLERLLARLEQAPNSALLCIEAEPDLHSLSLENFGDALKSNPRLRLVGRLGVEKLCSLVRREWGSCAFVTVKTIRLTGGWQLHSVLYDMMERTLQTEIAIDWGNAMTLARLGRRYARNAVRNLAMLPRHLSLGKLSFGREPVLVLGAGPSLSGTLDALSERFGEALLDPESRPFRIVCVDTCLPILKARGIAPDLAVVLESQHWNIEDFIGLAGWNIPVAMDLSALPRSAGVLAGNLYLFFTPWTQLRVFDRLEAAGLLPEVLPPLGSVGLSAVAIALRLSWGSVITSGLDFAFSLDLSHARSSPGHCARLRRQNRFTGLLNADAAFGPGTFVASSKNGGKVFSTPAMRNYRNLFEREFSEFGCSPPQLFDIAGSGLPLGLKTLPPETAFDILAANNGAAPQPKRAAESGAATAADTDLAEKLASFARVEQGRLSTLRGMLVGSADLDHGVLDTLIDECDYLWAHFPDYAAGKRRPPRAELEAGTPAAVSFLKRLRVEIDPADALITRCFGELTLQHENNGD